MASNPEFVRNVRSQMRPAKMVIAALIVAVLSLVLGFTLTHVSVPAAGPSGWGFGLLHLLFWLQALILAAGGGIACVNAIYKEKDHNTFDFQRVTRLSPLELALGKLFGAPAFLYFLCLCMVPIVIFAAVQGQQRFSFVIAAYAVLLVGSLAFQALCLLISLLTARGSHTTAIIGVLIILGLFSNIPSGLSYFFQVGSLSPFYAAQVSMQGDWTVHEPSAPWGDLEAIVAPSTVDELFGHTVRHVPVFLIVDALLAAWFLLATIRNIKRDPEQYELYSPLQSLGLVAFINLVLLAFVNWRSGPLIDIQAALLTANGGILGAVGLGLLRNRDRTRRLLRADKGGGESWINLAWPFPFFFIATAGAGLPVAGAATLSRGALSEWSPALAVFRSLFFAAWMLRDLQFLQWMVLRRGKRPLMMGVLYLTVFYVSVAILVYGVGIFRDADRVPFTAFFLPTPIYDLDQTAWMTRPAIWGAAFVAQWVTTGLLIYAQRNTILELGHPAAAKAVAATAE
ncbi:MAG TPA: hypothetical protein VKF79_11170 [Candidatus Acidoferrum sp.]|nr:hypothetical protein [Candidatus Acidoferrum sp.]